MGSGEGRGRGRLHNSGAHQPSPVGLCDSTSSSHTRAPVTAGKDKENEIKSPAFSCVAAHMCFPEGSGILGARRGGSKQTHRHVLGVGAVGRCQEEFKGSCAISGFEFASTPKQQHVCLRESLLPGPELRRALTLTISAPSFVTSLRSLLSLTSPLSGQVLGL